MMDLPLESPELSDDDRQLLELIEFIVAKPDAVYEDRHPLTDFVRRLAAARPTPDPAFAQRLEAQLMNTISSQHESRHSARRANAPRQLRLALAGVLGAIGLAAALILTIPPWRAWAQDLLGRIGPFAFTRGPTLPEQALTRTPEPAPTSTTRPSAQPPAEAAAQGQNVMTIEEAQALAPFTILTPAFLPGDMRLSSFYVLPGGAGSPADVTGTYSDPSDGAVLVVRQFPYEGSLAEAEFPIGDAPVTAVNVRGEPGLWVENANLGLNPSESGEGQLIQWSFLIWQETRDGATYLFWMFTHTLSQAEMMQVAESLVPAR